MRKYLSGFLVCGLLFFIVGAEILDKDANDKIIQAFVPNPDKSVVVTSTASRTFDQATNYYFRYTATTDTKGRIMPTAAKGTYPQFTIPADTTYAQAVGRAAVQFNISGGTGHYQAGN